jgi:hypothetical protein
MSKFLAPIVGLAVFLFALFTMPEVWAQTVTPPAGAAASLTVIPVLGDIILQIQKWLPVVFQIVGAFSMIAAMTANETDDKIVNAILKVINVLGMNFGTATNDPNVGVNRSGTPQP